MQRELKPLLENRVELRFYNERPFEEILKEVANLPPHSAIFFQQLTWMAQVPSMETRSH